MHTTHTPTYTHPPTNKHTTTHHHRPNPHTHLEDVPLREHLQAVRRLEPRVPAHLALDTPAVGPHHVPRHGVGGVAAPAADEVLHAVVGRLGGGGGGGACFCRAAWCGVGGCKCGLQRQDGRAAFAALVMCVRLQSLVPRHAPHAPSQDPTPSNPAQPTHFVLSHPHTRGALGGVDVHRVVQEVGDARLERPRQPERRAWRQQQQGGGGCMWIGACVWLDLSVKWGRSVGQSSPPDTRRASIYAELLSLSPRLDHYRWLTCRREPVRRQALPLLLLEGARRDECLRHGRGQQERPYYPLHHSCLLCVCGFG